MVTNNNVIFLASGGTGGHLFPAKALSSMLLDNGYECVILCDKRTQHYDFDPRLTTHVINSAAMNGRNIWQKILGVSKLLLGYGQARQLVNHYKPALIVGFGGYSTVPSLLAAHHKNVPIMLHEQNAILGKANRFLAPHAKVIMTSFKVMEFVDNIYIDKCFFSGNPVRASITKYTYSDYPVMPKANEPFRVVVTGGSQGAKVFSTLLPEAIALLPKKMQSRIELLQQVKEADIDHVQARYDAMGVKARLASFIDDIGDELAQCHLFIGRSGASTIAEITTIGRPAIFIPYPYAADNHQVANAQPLVDYGAGWIILENNGDVVANLATRLENILKHPKSLNFAAKAAKKYRVSNPEQALYQAVYDMLHGYGIALPPISLRKDDHV